MSNNSPQPWSYISRGSKHAKQRFIIDANGRLISHWPSEADAALMAAAPELLEALEVLLATSHPVHGGKVACAGRVRAKRLARLAIDKARIVSPSFLPLLEDPHA